MPSNRWSILALLFAVRAGMGLQYEIVAALSPLFMTDFALSIADVGLLIGLYHAPGAVLALPSGAIATRLGDKRVVIFGLVLMICGELVMALAPIWAMQIAGRLSAGTGGILLNVVMTKIVADWFADREIDTAMAAIGNASPFGIALALVTLPEIARAGGRVLASAAVAIYLVVALIALAVLYRAPPQRTASVPGQSFWPGRRALLAMLLAGVIYGLYNASLVTVFGFGPLMLTERGWTIYAASSTTSVVLWLVAVSLPAGGWLADRSGASSAILLGGLIGFALALVLASRVDAMLPAFVLLGIVGGLPCGPIMSLPARILSPETRSVGMGMVFTVYYAIQVAGPWLVGGLAEMAGSPRFAFDVGAIFLCIAAAVWILFRQLSTGIVGVKQAGASA